VLWECESDLMAIDGDWPSARGSGIDPSTKNNSFSFKYFDKLVEQLAILTVSRLG
jgi:hypothetical protein